MSDPPGRSCPVCGADTVKSGTKYSSFSNQTFQLRRCPSCAFVFVSNPRVDFDALYDDHYYSGRGADPLVDYTYEAEHADRTIRRYEWRGILKVVSTLTAVGPETKWLDYGCGTGGLVGYLQKEGLRHATGFEQGWGGEVLRRSGHPHVTSTELDQLAGTFDVVSLIEVIEHALDPVSELTRVRTLLRPGGLCFLTTGNARPFRDRITDWRYVVPDVHVSYFEPDNLTIALHRAGFETALPGFRDGWQDIIRFKVLKSLRRHTSGALVDALPWGVVSHLVDRRLEVTAHPVGWARAQ